MQKVTGQLFERAKFIGGTTAKLYPPKNRTALAKKLGGATTVYLQVRVYDRSSAGAPSINFEIDAGCFGDECPQLGLRAFAITPASVSPTALPWSGAGGFAPPDDGIFTLTPTMGMLAILLSVTGSATCWVEVEIWYTAVYAT